MYDRQISLKGMFAYIALRQLQDIEKNYYLNRTFINMD
jgi:hypothetical protein